jgi:DNA-binding NarL/FixJ family response regulator
MYLSSRELALAADLFKVLADQTMPEDALRLEVGQRMLELLHADHFGFCVRDGAQHQFANRVSINMSDDETIGDLRIWRGEHRENFSAHELALLDLIRPAFVAALARARAEASPAKPADVAAPAAANGAFSKLTRREREVVKLVVEGLLDKEIAERLGISYTTVRTHLDRSFQKLGVSNRSRLARIVQEAGR